VLSGRNRLEFLGLGLPLAILAGTATLSAILNYESLGSVPGQGALARLWAVAAALCAIGAVATISRTTVVMVIAIVAVGLWDRGSLVLRVWPFLLVLPVAIHFAVPGALGGIYRAFDPQQGLTSDLTTRSGESGSGRLADIEPGLNDWSESPLYGSGIGTQVRSGEAGAAETAVGAEGAIIYFDNEWLTTLVQLGVLGILGTAWLIFGTS
jgi:O-Antigen ligase